MSTLTQLLHGNNRLIIEEQLSELRRHIDPDGFNTTVVESANAHPEAVQVACSTPGFFGAERLVILRDLLGGQARSGAKKRSSKKENSDSNPLASIAPGTRLVIVEESLNRTDEKKLRENLPDIEVQQFDVPRARDLVNWTCERAKHYKATIEPPVATSLLEAIFPGSWRSVARRDDVPPDLYRLDAELAKLATAAGESETITRELVLDLVPDAEPVNIWGLSNAIADRNPAQAVQELQRSLGHGQPAELILAQLAAQFETFATLIHGQARDVSFLANKTGLTEGRLRQGARSARQFRAQEIADALQDIRALDFSSKQGLVDIENALPSLIVSLSTRK